MNEAYARKPGTELRETMMQVPGPIQMRQEENESWILINRARKVGD
jgi:hypothetical protein